MRKQKEILFVDYFEEWIDTYKVGAIAEITLNKYYVTLEHLKSICQNLLMSDFDRGKYGLQGVD